MTKPITPKQVVSPEVPGVVVDVFNELIQHHWDGHRAIIKQSIVNHMVVTKMKTIRPSFPWYPAKVKRLYQEAGWKVVYNIAPSVNSYKATLTFSIEDQDIAGCVVIVQDGNGRYDCLLHDRMFSTRASAAEAVDEAIRKDNREGEDYYYHTVTLHKGDNE